MVGGEFFVGMVGGVVWWYCVDLVDCWYLFVFGWG